MPPVNLKCLLIAIVLAKTGVSMTSAALLTESNISTVTNGNEDEETIGYKQSKPIAKPAAWSLDSEEED